ncbi:MAG: P-loop containing nucleoside triphosphate hydrolase protein [Monoraphidium minutum]|nr:MAG: P-loop containing nucleoside triphosphate hydrolase protein [Monoraphidium minutum]
MRPPGLLPGASARIQSAARAPLAVRAAAAPPHGRGGRAGGRPRARGPPPPRRGGEEFQIEEDGEGFVDDAAAARLRQILRRRGRDGIVDDAGRGLALFGGGGKGEGARGGEGAHGREARGGGEGARGGEARGGGEREQDDDGAGGGDGGGSYYDEASGAWVLGGAACARLRELEGGRGGERGGRGGERAERSYERGGERSERGGRGSERGERSFERGGDRAERGGERWGERSERGGRGGERGERSYERGGERGSSGGERGGERWGERGGRGGGGRGRELGGGRGAWGAAPGPPAPSAANIPIVRLDGGPGKGTFFHGSSWSELGASEDVISALKALGITRPSHVQVESYRALRAAGGRHVALADQAGSGKTLAYLLPLLQEVKDAEAAAGGRPAPVPGCPQVLIITPTGELAQQVHRVVKALVASGLKLRCALMTGGQEDEARRFKALRTQADTLKGGVDVVVATPGRAVALLKRGDLILDHTRAVVLDEVDVLCGGDEVYAEQVEPLQAAAPTPTRFVLVSATLPQHTFEKLREVFPGMEPAFGPGLHRVSAGVVEELVDCSGGDEVSLESGVARKLKALSACLERHGAQRAVVFCNKIEACRAVENHLRRHHRPAAAPAQPWGGSGEGGAWRQQQGAAEGAAEVERGSELKVYAYHEAVKEADRQAALAAFLTPAPPAPPPRPPVVLVCTDRTSRGIDTSYCDHVVLFDFPRDPSEYVRRAGRTARGAGGRGVVSVLVLGKQVPLAQEIIEMNQKGRPVHRIPEVVSRCPV